MGSDISGTWKTNSEISMLISIECAFESDGTCSVDFSGIDFYGFSLPAMEVEGSWSLNGTTVAIDASCSDSTSGTDLSTTQTYTYDSADATLTLKSIAVTGTAEGEEINIEYDDLSTLFTIKLERQ